MPREHSRPGWRFACFAQYRNHALAVMLYAGFAPGSQTQGFDLSSTSEASKPLRRANRREPCLPWLRTHVLAQGAIAVPVSLLYPFPLSALYASQILRNIRFFAPCR